ncbi:MAG: tail fiber domain-containing protein [Bacteroidota bacterium]|nr:hypothetical protein [Odoribacter sp.]MDP3643927.1 tail fiber domain-containing protein [Bacteroidota bacterium]
MKKLVIIFVLGFITLSFGAFAQIKVDASGNVGINNTTPGYRLDVTGNVRFYDSGSSKSITYTSGSFYSSLGSNNLGSSGNYWGQLYATQPFFTYSPVITSDKNFKTDIRDFDSVKDKLNLLRPVKYKLNLPDANGDITGGIEQFGFIAQEMQALFPEIVADRGDGMLGIRYTELIPILVKAYQEQQAELESLKARVAKLEGK